MKIKLFTLMAVLMTISSVSKADSKHDLCLDPQRYALAVQALQIVHDGGDSGVKVSSSGIQTCDPTSLLIAAQPSGNASGVPAAAPICGAVLTFKNESDMVRFSKWVIVAKPFLIDSLCVSVDLAQPMPAVSGSNVAY